MRIGLKPCEWERAGTALIVVCDPSRSVELDDPAGQVEHLLSVLREHPGTMAEVRASLAAEGLDVGTEELGAALSALDGLRMLRDVDRPVDRERAGRAFSNL